MRKYINDFAYYQLDKAHPFALAINTEDCNEITIVNQSIAGDIFVNDVAIQTGQNTTIKISGNENEVFYQGKLIVRWYQFFANINLAIVVIKKKFV